MPSFAKYNNWFLNLTRNPDLHATYTGKFNFRSVH